MRALSVAILCTALLAAQQCAAAGSSLRGLNPEFATRYSGDKGQFECLDGSKTIPFARVNDDYCDCADGSDEPGTPACYNGRFYCRNLGHEAKLLSTSFVDDGICDCCDGSDEPKTHCKNSCLQASAEHRDALSKKVDHFAAALEKKNTFIKDAHEKLLNWKERTQTIDAEIDSTKALVEQLRVEKEKAEAENAAAAAGEGAASEEQAQEEVATEEQPAGEEQAQEEAPATEESAEEIGRRIASQWTHDPEAAAVPHGEEQVNEEGGEHHDEGAEHHEGAAEGEAGDAVSRFYDAESSLAELEKEKQDIDRYLGGNVDLGPNNMFLAFADQCFTATQTRWTYEACPFKEAAQSEGYGINKVNIGHFRGFENNYSTMVFGDGDYCAGVGPRSFRLKMVCGDTEVLKDAEEPSTCQYSATLTTPLACTDDDLQKAKLQYEQLLAQEREIRAQIEAAERSEL